MRENLIKEKHSGGMAGHFGRDKTIAILREYYFWSQMSQDVKKFVQSCHVCQATKGFSHIRDSISHYLFHQSHGKT